MQGVPQFVLSLAPEKGIACITSSGVILSNNTNRFRCCVLVLDDNGGLDTLEICLKILHFFSFTTQQQTKSTLQLNTKIVDLSYVGFVPIHVSFFVSIYGWCLHFFSVIY